MSSLILVAVLATTLWIVYELQERSLYVLFVAAYTQNFVAPFLYTRGYASADLSRGLVLFKDFLLLELFGWSVIALFKHFQPPWPRPLKPLLLLCGYCAFRLAIGVVFLGDNWSLGFYRLRNIWFPLEILIVVIVLTGLKPEFGKRFLRDMTYILAVLAVVALAIFAFAPRDFWLDNANIAAFQSDVKGDTETDLNFDEGLTFTGTMQGREVLQFLSYFRAIGTFGEAIALAFSMSVPVLLLFFHYRWTTISITALLVCTAALLFSFTRSAWVFCAIVALYTMMRRHWYRVLVGTAACIVVLFLAFPPLADFATITLENISPSADNPDSAHAEGVLWFYTRAFSDPANILGKGMGSEAQDIPESGYAYLLERFGLVAYASFIWFCLSLYRQLRKPGGAETDLATLAQGIPLGILIIMHFSQYPFSLPSFMSLWYVVGLCLGRFLVPKAAVAEEYVPLRVLPPELRTT
jgi:hypothetical protein